MTPNHYHISKGRATKRSVTPVSYTQLMNEGELDVGDSIMYVLIGADIRPNCVDALQKLVGKIKNELVVEKEIYA